MISLPTCEVFNRPVSFKTQQGGVRLQCGKRGLLLRGMVGIWNTEWQHLEARDEEMKDEKGYDLGHFKVCFQWPEEKKKLQSPGIQPSEMQNVSDGKEGLGPSYRVCNAPGLPPVQLPSLRVPQSTGSSCGIYSAHYFFRFSQFMKGQSHRQEWCSAQTQ